jgi:hypothetical protein
MLVSAFALLLAEINYQILFKRLKWALFILSCFVAGGGLVGGGLGYKGGEAYGLKNYDTPLWKTTANDFYAKHNPALSPDDYKSQINGIDFSKPVKAVNFPSDGLGAGKNELYQYTKVNTEGTVLRGQYYTDDVNATPNDLGLSDKYSVKDLNWNQTDEVRLPCKKE